MAKLTLEETQKLLGAEKPILVWFDKKFVWPKSLHPTLSAHAKACEVVSLKADDLKATGLFHDWLELTNSAKVVESRPKINGVRKKKLKVEYLF